MLICLRCLFRSIIKWQYKDEDVKRNRHQRWQLISIFLRNYFREKRSSSKRRDILMQIQALIIRDSLHNIDFSS